MKTVENTYLQWRHEDGEIQYYSIAEILEIGNPIDSDGQDLDLARIELFEFVGGKEVEIK